MDSILNFVVKLSASNLRLRPIARQMAQAFFPCARSYLSLDEEQKNEIKRILDRKTSYKLLGVSGMCAELAYQGEPEDWVEAGIICHLIENFSTDFRENFRYLVLLDDVSKLKSIDFAEKVSKLSHYGTDVSRIFLQNWLCRPVALNNIGSFYIEREFQEGNLIYRQKK